MSIEFFVDNILPRTISSYVLEFKPYDEQHKLIMDQIIKFPTEQWMEVFKNLWNDISRKSGISNIGIYTHDGIRIINQKNIIRNSCSIHDSSLSLFEKKISMPLEKLVNIDYDDIIKILKVDKVYEIPTHTEMNLHYEGYVDDLKYFEYFDLDETEWELEKTCICGNSKTFVRRNISFVFKLHTKRHNFFGRYYYSSPCNCYEYYRP